MESHDSVECIGGPHDGYFLERPEAKLPGTQIGDPGLRIIECDNGTRPAMYRYDRRTDRWRYYAEASWKMRKA
jgi:hypothetical protein